MKRFFIGIDPGQTGGWALIDSTDNSATAYRFESHKVFYKSIPNVKQIFCCLEDVHSSPQQGVVSAFSFGDNFGGWKAALTVLEIQYKLVAPQLWQRLILGKFSPGDSKITAARYAQKKWPELNLRTTQIDSGRVDALCIARYAQRLFTKTAL